MVTARDSCTSTERRAVQPLQITVLMGGPSAERDVSLNTGEAIARALESLGHRVRRADICPEDLSALDHPSDVYFVALHGTWGEDGQLQAILEQRGVRYTGCDARASALAMDKVRTKRRFIEAGIPTAPFEHVTPANVESVAESFEIPAVVKPVAEGSSVGCVIAMDREAFGAGVRRLTAQYGEALAERYLSGPELTVGLLNGEALPVCQIRPKAQFYDYHAKYEADDTEYLFDIDLPDELLRHVEQLSAKAYEALGCRDMARIDWIVEARGGEPFCLEVNTIPGFTSHSLLPKSAAQAGIGFAELCERLVLMAMRRQRAPH